MTSQIAKHTTILGQHAVTARARRRGRTQLTHLPPTRSRRRRFCVQRRVGVSWSGRGQRRAELGARPGVAAALRWTGVHGSHCGGRGSVPAVQAPIPAPDRTDSGGCGAAADSRSQPTSQTRAEMKHCSFSVKLLTRASTICSRFVHPYSKIVREHPTVNADET